MGKINTEKLESEIKNEALVYLSTGQVQPLNLSGYKKYLKTGNRLKFENDYFSRRKQLVTLALALTLTLETEQREKITSLLEEVIWAVCNEYTWALPAHLTITEEGLFHDGSPFVIDLFAAETAQTLSEIIERDEINLSELIVKRVHTEIEMRVLKPFEEKEWDWELLENNWSAVIASCIGMTALSILEFNNKRQLSILKRLNKSFNSYFEGFGKDGICTEGIGYWAYGFGYYIYFSEKYKRIYNDDFYLKKPILKNIASFPYNVQIGLNSFVPFSDVSNEMQLPSGLLSFCQNYFNVPVPYMNEASSLDFDHCYRWAHVSRNLHWHEKIKQNSHSKNNFFNDSEWLVAVTEGKMVFAAKGGNNDESHNHNDVGHFVFGMEDELILSDLGSGEYTQDYFNEKTRYSFINNRSRGHSVPVINNVEQRSGPYEARNVKYEKNVSGFTFELNLEDVYGENAKLKTYKRLFTLNEKKEELKITDEMTFLHEEENVIEQSFISKIKPEINNNKIIWKGKGCEIILECSLADLSPIINEEKYYNHYGKLETAYRLGLKKAVINDLYHLDLHFKFNKKET